MQRCICVFHNVLSIYVFAVIKKKFIINIRPKNILKVSFIKPCKHIWIPPPPAQIKVQGLRPCKPKLLIKDWRTVHLHRYLRPRPRTHLNVCLFQCKLRINMNWWLIIIFFLKICFEISFNSTNFYFYLWLFILIPGKSFPYLLFKPAYALYL